MSDEHVYIHVHLSIPGVSIKESDGWKWVSGPITDPRSLHEQLASIEAAMANKLLVRGLKAEPKEGSS